MDEPWKRDHRVYDAMDRICPQEAKPQTERTFVAAQAWAWEWEEWVATANGHGISFLGDESSLRLDTGNGRTTLNILESTE